MKIYVIGSLRNPNIPVVAEVFRRRGYEVYDDWYSPGPETDDFWQAHCRQKGLTYKEALNGHHARDIFSTDKKHLDSSDAVVLVLPAGKSGHMELGYAVGKGKPALILFDKEPERYDLMYRFAEEVCFSVDDAVEALAKISRRRNLLERLEAEK